MKGSKVQIMKRTLGTTRAVLTAVTLWASGLHAATFVVSNNTDSGPGSLRQAILDANAGGGGTIDLTGVTGTITLGTNLPTITTSVNLLGPGTNALTISASNAYVAFTMQAGTSNTMANLAIADGSARFIGPPAPVNDKASGIRNFGSLKLQGCLLRDCFGNGTSGGAIYNSGSLEMDSCLITHCGAKNVPSGVYGGGIYNAGQLTMKGCTCEFCVGENGGGLFTQGGSTLLTQCIIASCGTDNQGDAGAIYHNGGQLTLVACVISNNAASYIGGGILSTSSLAMTNTTIVHNSSFQGGGGGLYFARSANATASCFNCTISGNGCGSGLGGGGIRNLQTLTLVNCTISGNSCLIDLPAYEGGGGIENFNLLNMTNCTVSGNASQSQEAAFPSHGGGILNQTNALAFLVDCTVVSNTAASAMGIENAAGKVYTQNSIIANNGVDFSGILSSQGYNLIGNTNGCALEGEFGGNQYGVDPLLGPLQNNGGPTLTHALLLGSPAIDAGPANSAPFFDQRGAPRPFGAADDIGAFEFGTAPSHHIALLTPSPSGCLQVKMAGTPGFIYMVQRASAPSGPWTPLSVITADAEGAGICLDPTPPSDRAFYRTVFP